MNMLGLKTSYRIVLDGVDQSGGKDLCRIIIKEMDLILGEE